MPNSFIKQRHSSIISCDALSTLRGMASGSVHCIVTSPPYFGLRDYGHSQQIGGEASPECYVAALTEIFREARRVLRDDGVMWLNLGDSYSASGGSGAQGTTGQRASRSHTASMADKKNTPGYRPKQLLGIPWRVALALQSDGWWLRQDIIWSKPNPVPESVKDRCTRSHEYLFLLSKRERYFFDHEAIKEPALSESISRANKRDANGKPSGAAPEVAVGCFGGLRNKRSVWDVPVARYKDAHTATFPPDLIIPCIQSGTSAGGCCAGCGAPLTRIQSTPPAPVGVTIGWRKTCGCKTRYRHPCVVLDIFGGAGTTGLVADRLGRVFNLIELNPQYVDLARNRILTDRISRLSAHDEQTSQFEMFAPQESPSDASLYPAYITSPPHIS